MDRFKSLFPVSSLSFFFFFDDKCRNYDGKGTGVFNNDINSDENKKKIKNLIEHFLLEKRYYNKLKRIFLFLCYFYLKIILLSY